MRNVYKTINGTKKKIGFINSNNNFVAPKTHEHFMRKENGFGINHEIFQNLKDKVNKIIIKYTRKNDKKEEVYIADTSTWEEKGNIATYVQDEQIFLDVDDFDEAYVP